VARKHTILAQTIVDKFKRDTGEEIDVDMIERALAYRDKIVGERSSYNRGMSDTQPNWGRRG